MSDLLDMLAGEQVESERFARRSDPGPSKTAADSGDSFGPLCVRVLATLVEVERTCPHRVGGTANEIRERMAYDPEPTPDRNSVSRRLTSLMRRGFVRDTGERRDGGRGVEVCAYSATREGRDWLTERSEA